ncbi:MAG: two-component regulator propeller domain-containing protein [Bacteroidota bacterium]
MPILLWTQTGLAQSFDFRNYSVGQGLAQSQVYALLEDQRGYIWMGTQGGGLSRFDGQDFHTWSTTTQPELINNYVLTLFEDSQGYLWIGTKAGLSRFDGLRLFSYPISDSISMEVYAVAEDAKGNIYVGTHRGLYRQEGGGFVLQTVENGYPPGKIHTMMLDADKDLWVGHEGGLTKIQADGQAIDVGRAGLVNREIISLAEDLEGNIWAGTLGGGLHSFDGTRFTEFRGNSRLRNSVVFDLLVDREGNLWIATLKAGAVVRQARDSSLMFFSDADGLARNHIRCLLEDSWGNIWLGTSGGGVSKYHGQEFIHYDRSNGLAGRSIYSVAQDSAGRFWLGNHNQGFSIFDKGEITSFNRQSGYQNVQIKTILRDQQDRMWLGTYGQGISLFLNDTTYKEFGGVDGLGDSYIWDIEEDKGGHIWVATAGGGITEMIPVVDTTDSLNWSFDTRIYRTGDGLPQNRINCLHIDSLNRIWFGTMGRGIGYIQAGTVRMSQSLPGGSSNNSVRSMVEDESGFLWIGTAGGGVNRMFLYPEQDTFPVRSFSDGLTSENVYLLACDRQQHIWIGTEAGVDRATLDPDRNIIEIKHFGRSEGFVGIEVCQNAVFLDSSDNLWFGTVNGITKYNPRTNVEDTLAPKISLTETSLLYTPLQELPDFRAWVEPWGDIQRGLEFSHKQNTLSFGFIGINHHNPEQVRYSWRMKEWEKDWRPETYQREATYPQLPPGAYTFQLKAVNEDGVWTEKPLEVSFTINPPYWQTWLFRGIVLTLLGLIVAISFRLRVNQIRRKVDRERQRLEMEKDLLDLEQKALRLQMNPHFIFHALNSIQHLIAQQDAKTARYYLAKFARLMRNVLENSRESMIPISEEIQILEDYLTIEQFSREKNFDYQIEIDEWVDPDNFLIPPMLIQPFVENAIIHGVAHLDHNGHIRIKFERIDQHVECVIIDNGIGREQATKINSQKDQHHKSTALVVTQERLDILHNSGDWDKSIVIKDLADPAGRPAGTQVLLRIPVKLID